MNDAERRIPIQYAKRVVGRKMYQGQSTHIPIKVGVSGVLPVIFASSILSIPSTIQIFLGDSVKTGFWKGFFDAFTTGGWIYCIIFAILIILFAFFYVTIQYNPVEIANNLRQNNGSIPGIRPGKPTSDYIAKILSKITLIGEMCIRDRFNRMDLLFGKTFSVFWIRNLKNWDMRIFLYQCLFRKACCRRRKTT